MNNKIDNNKPLKFYFLKDIIATTFDSLALFFLSIRTSWTEKNTTIIWSLTANQHFEVTYRKNNIKFELKLWKIKCFTILRLLLMQTLSLFLFMSVQMRTQAIRRVLFFSKY